MKVFPIWRCAGSAGVYLSVESRKDTNERHCRYHLQWGVSIRPKEVADFLEQDWKREQAQDKLDERHLSKSEFETVLSGLDCTRRPVEDAVLWNLRLETLRKAVDGLNDQGQDLIELRYGRGLTMEEIGKIYGVSKMAASLDGSWRLCRLEPSRPPCGESG